MAERPKELPELPQRLDQAILDPLLTNEQLLEMCDAAVSYTHLTLPTTSMV